MCHAMSLCVYERERLHGGGGEENDDNIVTEGLIIVLTRCKLPNLLRSFQKHLSVHHMHGI